MIAFPRQHDGCEESNYKNKRRDAFCFYLHFMASYRIAFTLSKKLADLSIDILLQKHLIFPMFPQE